MSDGELVVHPATLTAFATALQDHANALGTALQGLRNASQVGLSGELFGNFDQAAAVNHRSKQLLDETAAQLDTVVTALTNLYLVAQNAATMYQATDAKSADALKLIDNLLGQTEAGTYSVGTL